MTTADALPVVHKFVVGIEEAVVPLIDEHDPLTAKGVGTAGVEIALAFGASQKSVAPPFDPIQFQKYPLAS